MTIVNPIIVPIQLSFAGNEQAIAEEQARLRQIYNKTAGKSAPASSFAQMASRMNTAYGSDAAAYGQLRGQHPSLARATDRYNTFAAGPIQGPTQRQVEQQALQVKRDQLQLERQLNEQRRLTLVDMRASLSAQRDKRAQQQRATMATGVFSSGTGGALSVMGRNLLSIYGGTVGAQSTLGAPATGLGQVSIAGSTTQAAGTLTSAAGGILNSVAEGGVPPGGAGGASAGVVSGLMGMVKHAVEVGTVASAAGPEVDAAAVALTFLAGLATAGNAVNQVIADLRTQQYALQSAVVGAGSTQALYSNVLGVGGQYQVNPDQAVQLATELGGQGVHGGAFLGDVSNTLALQRLAPDVSQQEATSVVGSLATHGHMGDQQIGALFDTFYRGAQLTGTSFSKLIDNLSAFQQATNGVALTVRGYEQLLGVQGVLGPNINAGSVMSGAVNATGSSALGLSGMLGISPAELYKEQTTARAALFDRQARFLQSATSGATGQKRIDIAEAINAQLTSAGGGFNVQGLSLTDQEKLFNSVLNQGGKPAEALYERLTKQVGTPSAATFQAAGQQAAGNQTTKVQQVANSKLVEALQALDHLLPGIPNARGQTSGGANPAAGAGAAAGAAGTALMTAWGAMQQVFFGNNYMNPAGSAGGNAGSGPALSGYRYSIATPNPHGSGTLTATGALAAAMYGSADAMGLDPRTLTALSAYESSLNPNTPDSAAGAQGIAQFLPSTSSWLLGVKSTTDAATGKTYLNPQYGNKNYSNYNPEQATQLQAFYLRYLVDTHHDNLNSALMAYSGNNVTEAAVVGANTSQGQITITVVDKTAGGVKASVQQALNPATNQNPGRPTQGRPSPAPPPKNPHKKGQ